MSCESSALPEVSYFEKDFEIERKITCVNFILSRTVLKSHLFLVCEVNYQIDKCQLYLCFLSVLKLLKMAKGIRALLDTVGQALPQVTNLGSLFFLLFFIFATLGVELFGKLGKLR